MKTKEQVENETGADVFTLDEFERAIDHGMINCCDGIGFFHDGEHETEISVWGISLWSDIKDYPYVCWYGK